jgi:aspartyl protease family protein
MLLRTAIFAAVIALLATQIPALLEHVEDEEPATAPLVERPAAREAVSASPGNTVLQADGRGHFTGAFRINGKSVPGLVDTGASLVAMNESTARRLGFGANGLDFRYTVNTANGSTQAAHVILDRIEIGNIRVRDVEAFVLRDKALSSTLVGMSFLSKLKSYQVKGDSLTLAN